MISLETAKKLKEAGLEWEPKFGDYYKIPVVFEDGMTEVMDIKQVMSYHKNPEEWEESINSFVFIPRLDQLLAEIERLGWKYELRNDEAGIDYVCFVFSEGYNEYAHANTPTNAAAEALLWIYERRNQHES